MDMKGTKTASEVAGRLIKSTMPEMPRSTLQGNINFRVRLSGFIGQLTENKLSE